MHKMLFGAVLLLALCGQINGSEKTSSPITLEFLLANHGERPRERAQPPPALPYELSRAGISGWAQVAFVVGEDGRVRDARAVEWTNTQYARSAEAAVARWLFKPAQLNGKAVAVELSQLVEFDLGVGPGSQPTIAEIPNHEKLPPEFQWETPPIRTDQTAPVYPFALLREGEAGDATVRFAVTPEGRVASAKLVGATFPEMGQAALAVMDLMRFKPATDKHRKPCYAVLTVHYRFVPSGEGHVPVSREAREILSELEKSVASAVPRAELDAEPGAVAQTAPVYPSSLLPEGRNGNAVVEFFLDRTGRVQLPRIVSCSAPEFGYAAVQAVATWRYAPPKRNGKPVVVKLQIPIGFGSGEKAKSVP